MIEIALVAQWIEYQTSNLTVVRSSRTEGAKERSIRSGWLTAWCEGRRVRFPVICLVGNNLSITL